MDDHLRRVQEQTMRSGAPTVYSSDVNTQASNQAVVHAAERIQGGLSAVAYALLAVAEAIEHNGFLKMEDDNG